MRVLIIGGTRFIGPQVVRELNARGHEIALFHRGQTETEIPRGVKQIYGDRRSIRDYAAGLIEYSPHVVVDMIPISETDAEGVVSVFRGNAQRVVAISSQDVYRAYGVLIGTEQGPVQLVPLSEQAALRRNHYPYRDRFETGHRLYDYDKILVERVYLNDLDLPATILRLPMVYGPGDYQHRLYPYLKRMQDDRPAIILEQGLAAFRWSRGYVEDIASAVALAVTSEIRTNRIYNVAEPHALNESQWVRVIAEEVGWNGKLVTVERARLPENLQSGIHTAQDLVADTSRIRRELGYSEKTSMRSAIRKTIEWESANPPEVIDPDQFDYPAEDRLLGSLAG